MRFYDLMRTFAYHPLFTLDEVRAHFPQERPDRVRQTLYRWVKRGWLQRVRRGLYVLAPGLRAVEPSPYALVPLLTRGGPAYLSMEAVLDMYGLIPEAVHEATAVTLGRPGLFETPIGRVSYQHIHPDLFFGFREEDIGLGYIVPLARPEKALLDLVYFRAPRDPKGLEAFLVEMRLHGLVRLDPQILTAYARRMHPSPRSKMNRAVCILLAMREEEIRTTRPLY